MAISSWEATGILLKFDRVAALVLLGSVFGCVMSKAFTEPTVKGSAETQETEDPFIGVYAGTFFPGRSERGNHHTPAPGPKSA